MAPKRVEWILGGSDLSDSSLPYDLTQNNKQIITAGFAWYPNALNEPSSTTKIDSTTNENTSDTETSENQVSGSSKSGSSRETGSNKGKGVSQSETNIFVSPVTRSSAIPASPLIPSRRQAVTTPKTPVTLSRRQAVTTPKTPFTPSRRPLTRPISPAISSRRRVVAAPKTLVTPSRSTPAKPKAPFLPPGRALTKPRTPQNKYLVRQSSERHLNSEMLLEGVVRKLTHNDGEYLTRLANGKLAMVRPKRKLEHDGKSGHFVQVVGGFGPTSKVINTAAPRTPQAVDPKEDSTPIAGRSTSRKSPPVAARSSSRGSSRRRSRHKKHSTPRPSKSTEVIQSTLAEKVPNNNSPHPSANTMPPPYPPVMPPYMLGGPGGLMPQQQPPYIIPNSQFQHPQVPGYQSAPWILTNPQDWEMLRNSHGNLPSPSAASIPPAVPSFSAPAAGLSTMAGVQPTMASVTPIPQAHTLAPEVATTVLGPTFLCQIFHRCVGCGKVRSRKYHHLNPIEPGVTPPPSYCRRCQEDDSCTEDGFYFSTPRRAKRKQKEKLEKHTEEEEVSTEEEVEVVEKRNSGDSNPTRGRSRLKEKQKKQASVSIPKSNREASSFSPAKPQTGNYRQSGEQSVRFEQDYMRELSPASEHLRAEALEEIRRRGAESPTSSLAPSVVTVYAISEEKLVVDNGDENPGDRSTPSSSRYRSERITPSRAAVFRPELPSDVSSLHSGSAAIVTQFYDEHSKNLPPEIGSLSPGEAFITKDHFTGPLHHTENQRLPRSQIIKNGITEVERKRESATSYRKHVQEDYHSPDQALHHRNLKERISSHFSRVESTSPSSSQDEVPQLSPIFPPRRTHATRAGESSNVTPENFFRDPSEDSSATSASEASKKRLQNRQVSDAIIPSPHGQKLQDRTSSPWQAFPPMSHLRDGTPVSRKTAESHTTESPASASNAKAFQPGHGGDGGEWKGYRDDQPSPQPQMTKEAAEKEITYRRSHRAPPLTQPLSVIEEALEVATGPKLPAQELIEKKRTDAFKSHSRKPSNHRPPFVRNATEGGTEILHPDIFGPEGMAKLPSSKASSRLGVPSKDSPRVQDSPKVQSPTIQEKNSVRLQQRRPRRMAQSTEFPGSIEVETQRFLKKIQNDRTETRGSPSYLVDEDGNAVVREDEESVESFTPHKYLTHPKHIAFKNPSETGSLNKEKEGKIGDEVHNRAESSQSQKHKMSREERHKFEKKAEHVIHDDPYHVPPGGERGWLEQSLTEFSPFQARPVRRQRSSRRAAVPPEFPGNQITDHLSAGSWGEDEKPEERSGSEHKNVFWSPKVKPQDDGGEFELQEDEDGGGALNGDEGDENEWKGCKSKRDDNAGGTW